MTHQNPTKPSHTHHPVEALSTTNHTEKSRIIDLINLTQALSDIFAQENKLLSTRRAGEIASLQAEKAKLATAYASTIKEIATNRPEVENVGEVLLTKLREITTSFNDLASEQKILLTAAHNASADIVQAISEEASGGGQQTKTTSSNYTYQGTKYKHNGPVVVSINQRA